MIANPTPLGLAAHLNVLAAQGIAAVPALEGVAIGDGFAALQSKWNAFVKHENALASGVDARADVKASPPVEAAKPAPLPTAADVSAAITHVANVAAIAATPDEVSKAIAAAQNLASALSAAQSLAK